MAALSPVSAQKDSGADTMYTFRFVPQKDMFYVPMYDNEQELERLLDCIDLLMSGITNGTVPVYIDGYCSSMDSEKENLATAAVRSNRVKSELIIRKSLTEDCFVTANHTTGGDVVTVRIKVPAKSSDTVKYSDTAVDTREETAVSNREDVSDNITYEKVSELSADEASAEPAAEFDETDGVSGAFSLRFNLLRWATLTPDLGLEWRVCPSWGIMVNGSWTSWSWNDKDRRYALWEVAPEVRYYIGKAKRGYLGAMFKVGEFNYKLSATGRQGDLIGGGLTGGYLLRLNKSLDLDFSIALGYLNADFEKYEVIDGVRVRRGNETKNWWGPVNAGVTLVWNLF